MQYRLPSRSRQFWIVACFLVLVALTGGSSRSDALSLMFLRPIAVVATFFGFSRWSRREWATYRPLVGLMGAAVALVLLHIIPLPPAVWHMLPGRGIIRDVDIALGTAGNWRPLTMTPEPALNALFSMFVPLAILGLVGPLDREERFSLLPLLIGLGVLSGTMGLLQAVVPGSDALYLYVQSDRDMAVGLFANRNHAAIYLATLIPMLAVFATSGRRTGRRRVLRPWISTMIGIMLVPLLLVTGSRNGMLVGLLGLVAVPFLLAPRSEASVVPYSRAPGVARLIFAVRRRGVLIAIGGIVVAVLAAWAFAGSRGVAIDRLALGSEGESRLLFWSATWHAIAVYFPFGSGAGSFVEAYKVIEPTVNLAAVYANHAHNDWLEVAMTLGLPGILLMVAALIFWATASWRAWRRVSTGSRQVWFARLGSVCLLILALASIADYPLRVPSLMCVAVIMAVWLLGCSAEALPSSPPARQNRNITTS